MVISFSFVTYAKANPSSDYVANVILNKIIKSFTLKINEVM